MTREKFEQLIKDGYLRLPVWVRNKIQNVALLVEDIPTREEMVRQGLADDETLLGLYRGVPLPARGDLYGVGMTLPDTITLYQRPIEDAADAQRKDVRDVVAETIWHEVAHHFGIDEAGVRSREAQRDSGAPQ